MALDYQMAISRRSTGSEARISVSQGIQTWGYSLHVSQVGLLDAEMYIKSSVIVVVIIENFFRKMAKPDCFFVKEKK